MVEVTQILSRAQGGDSVAAEQLLKEIYDELRKLASAKLAMERPGQTLQATALVHEAYLNLIGNPEGEYWNSRGHFFGAAAEAMRRILIDQVRAKATAKRGGDWSRMPLDQVATPGGIDPSELVALNDVFEQLAAQDPQVGEIAKLRIFAGFTIPEIADLLQVPKRTVDRQWSFARAWMRTQLEGQ